MLYSPTLHQFQSVALPDPTATLHPFNDQMVFWDTSLARPQRLLAHETGGEDCIIFDLVSGSDRVAATPSISAPKFTFAMPFRYAFRGAFFTVSSAVTGNPGACAGIHRNGVNVFTNSPAVSSLNALICSGTATPVSSLINAHASHSLWLPHDRIAIYLTSYNTGGSGHKGGRLYMFGSKAEA